MTPITKVDEITPVKVVVAQDAVEKSEPESVELVEPEVVMYRVTAYCSCEKCCGKWAKLRPLDEHGNPIVKGAAGTVLATGISCASTYPFGTEINLNGFGTVIVEDRTAGWVVDKYGENIIDIYFDDHQTAREFGVQYMEGVVLDEFTAS